MSEGEARRFYGKYRSVVLNNVDPLQKGRLLLQAPDVDGLLPTTWATPCLPFAGRQMGMWALPQIGAGVWVEFEQGDADYPVWTGSWYASASEPPALALAAVPAAPNFVIQTQGQTTLLLSDTPGPTGGIMIKTLTGAFISITDVGITLSNGKGAIITMTGPTVTVNNGALVVT